MSTVQRTDTLLAILAASMLIGFIAWIVISNPIPDATQSEYNDGTVTLDLAQWQCRQAETVLALVDDKLTPVGQCTRYERVISED